VCAGVRLIGCVGRLVPVKGISYLIAALPEIIRAVPSAQLVVVGDGPERDPLERQARHLGMAGQVRFVGWRSDLERIYPDLDVVVLPSLREGTPVVLIEAMAAGRPVVATRVGGVPDVVADGDTGLLVPSRDPRALAEAVAKILQGTLLARRLGDAGRVSVITRFAIVRLATDMEGFYRVLLDRRSIGRGTLQ
jgi:glycosyltransferase involved in cell wall biosynthesis